MTKVRNDDRPTDNQGDVQRIDDLLFGVAGLDALVKVIVDAVVASQDGRGREAEQLLGAAGQGAVLVGGGIKPKEPLQSKMIVGGEPSLTFGPLLAKLLDRLARHR